jgi:hypothetical protein
LVFCSRLDGDKLTSQEKEMSILKSIGFVAGHYECRSLAETLPVFTDLLAMEVVERTASVATLKHPNTEWRLIVHEGGLQRSPRQYLAPVNRFTLQLGSAAEVEQAHREFVSHKNSLGLNEITDIYRADGTVNFIFSDPDKNGWKLTANG